MVTLEEITVIHAPVERCFDLARSVDLRQEGMANAGEQPTSGTSSALLGLDDEVIWPVRYLGTSRNITLRVSRLEAPRFLQFRMVSGPFRLFEHDHLFVERGQGLVAMKDTLRFAAALPGLGMLAEQGFKTYLLKFLSARNQLLLRAAESEEWEKYLQRV